MQIGRPHLADERHGIEGIGAKTRRFRGVLHGLLLEALEVGAEIGSGASPGEVLGHDLLIGGERRLIAITEGREARVLADLAHDLELGAQLDRLICFDFCRKIAGRGQSVAGQRGRDGHRCQSQMPHRPTFLHAPTAFKITRNASFHHDLRRSGEKTLPRRSKTRIKATT